MLWVRDITYSLFPAVPTSPKTPPSSDLESQEEAEHLWQDSLNLNETELEGYMELYGWDVQWLLEIWIIKYIKTYSKQVKKHVP